MIAHLVVQARTHLKQNSNFIHFLFPAILTERWWLLKRHETNSFQTWLSPSRSCRFSICFPCHLVCHPKVFLLPWIRTIWFKISPADISFIVAWFDSFEARWAREGSLCVGFIFTTVFYSNSELIAPFTYSLTTIEGLVGLLYWFTTGLGVRKVTNCLKSTSCW